ncbi:MAG: alpha-L-fucosidase [Bacteroidota bacterium]|nr:alpha-L-fucosidase [Bacteroidota bacterium]
MSTTNSFAQIEESDHLHAGNKNKPERQEWLRDKGFGMFIHLGFDSQLGIVISHSLVGASEDYVNQFYNELPKTFDPYKFDAYKIATLAKLAGMKYIVFTTKHHSGFCMWDTKTTDLKITNTPYRKDLLKEYVAGVRKAGLAVGFYYSPEDFKFLHDHHITIQRGGIKLDAKTEKAYNDLVRRQTHELFSNYGKIDVLFIDGEREEACREEAWKLQPDLVITRGAVNTPEQTLPGVANNTLWESCITMGTQWQYKPTNDDLKSAGRLIEILVETRAKGGNLLLDVGPHPDGNIPDPQESRLREMAAWHFINHEAIEKVRPWIITHEKNIWFTASKDRKTVYVVITGIPDWKRGDRKEFVLGSVKATPETKISVLGQNDLVSEYENSKDVHSRFSQQEDGLHISIVRAQRIYNNNKWPDPITVKLENVVPALGPPVVETLEAAVSGNTVTLKGYLAKKGDAEKLMAGFEYRPFAGFVENLYSKEWSRTPLVTLTKEGPFSMELKDLKKNESYEFRAVLIHPRMTIYGDVKQFKQALP